MKILVVNGPNLNMLGKRPKEHYGTLTLDEINNMIKDYAKDIDFEFFQSNHEGDIVDRIQKLDFDALIINPAAYTHTSVAIRDVLEIVDKPKVEVHLSDVFNREDFRRIDYVKDACDKTITNMKEQGYIEAVKYLQNIL